MLLLVWAACHNNTLFAPCASDEDCAGGLSCLETVEPAFTTSDTGVARSTICTRTCEADADCPVEPGCGGRGDLRRADCLDGVCTVKLCD
jgi:hypothetical protein